MQKLVAPCIAIPAISEKAATCILSLPPEHTAFARIIHDIDQNGLDFWQFGLSTDFATWIPDMLGPSSLRFFLLMSALTILLASYDSPTVCHSLTTVINCRATRKLAVGKAVGTVSLAYGYQANRTCPVTLCGKKNQRGLRSWPSSNIGCLSQ